MEQMNAVEMDVVDTHFELTDEIKAALKENLGNKLKTVKFDGQVYVFKPLTKLEWDTYIIKWLQERTRVTKQEVSQEERHQRLLDVSIVFPSMPITFANNPAIKLLFWNNVPAGVPSKLVNLIQHHSGYFVPGYPGGIIDTLVAEDMTEPEPMEPRPTEEMLDTLRNSTDMPCKLLRVGTKWWVIRGLRYSEAKLLKKNLMQDPDSNYELQSLKNCILLGDTNFNALLAGVVQMLIVTMNEVSGLSAEGDPSELMDIEVDDL
jgi:hypothetical protein